MLLHRQESISPLRVTGLPRVTLPVRPKGGVVVMVALVAFCPLPRIFFFWGGERFDGLLPRLRFCLFVFQVKISSRTPSPLFRPNQSTVAQRAETAVAEYSLTSHV